MGVLRTADSMQVISILSCLLNYGRIETDVKEYRLMKELQDEGYLESLAIVYVKESNPQHLTVSGKVTDKGEQSFNMLWTIVLL